MILKIAIYICNYIPLFLLIFLNELKRNNESFNRESICFVLSEYMFVWIIIFILSLSSITSLFILWLQSSQTSNEKIGELKNTNIDILNYFITYLIPLLSLDLSNIYSILINIILFFILGIFHVKSEMLHYNIVLVLLGFNIYVNNNSKVFISKKNKDNINDNDKVSQIGSTNYFIIE